MTYEARGLDFTFDILNKKNEELEMTYEARGLDLTYSFLIFLTGIN